jgi:hypothetical protein
MMSRFLAMTLSDYVRSNSHFERCLSTVQILQQSADLVNLPFCCICYLLCGIETESRSLVTEAMKDLK